MKIPCRICDNSLKTKILTLEDMPLTDDFVSVSNKSKREYLNNINIYLCNKCGITQNPIDFNHEEYYQDYQYSAAHSDFVQNFMKLYAEETLNAFKKYNNNTPKSVLEIGSGDGEQLRHYKLLGINDVLGIEPSKYLADIANNLNIDTKCDLFDLSLLSEINQKFDICLSSFTFDHVRKPLDYLTAAYKVLNDNGILALEIHDLEKIVKRNEYCLFEHEHTIYMTSSDITFILNNSGFSVLSVNPLKQSEVRGNSMIVIAKKDRTQNNNFNRDEIINYSNLQSDISTTISKINTWINNLPSSSSLVGFGAGGRGVMTTSTLDSYKTIEALLDSNYKSNKVLSPKTRIPILGRNDWHKYKDAYCIIFSFGYYDEIYNNLIEIGFNGKKIVSLLDFYPSN